MEINEINNTINDYLEEIDTNLDVGEIISLLMVAIVLEILLFRTSQTLPWFLQGFLGIHWKFHCILLACILIRKVLNKLRRSWMKRLVVWLATGKFQWQIKFLFYFCFYFPRLRLNCLINSFISSKCLKMLTNSFNKLLQ